MQVHDEQREGRKGLPAWTLWAAGATSATLALALVGAWVFRAPLLEHGLRSWLSARGVDSQFDVAAAGFDGAILTGVRLGDARQPAGAARSVALRFGWGLGPRITGISADGVALKAQLTDDGISFGPLDALRPPPTGAPFEAPAIALDIRTARLTIESAQGSLVGTLSAQGALRGTLAGRLDLQFTPTSGEALAASFTLNGAPDALTLTSVEPVSPSPLRLTGEARAPWSPEGAAGAFEVALTDWTISGARLEGLEGALTFAHPGSGARGQAGLRQARFSGQLARFSVGGASMQAAGIEARAGWGSAAAPGALTLALEAEAERAVAAGLVVSGAKVSGTSVRLQDGLVSIPFQVTGETVRFSAETATAIERRWLRLSGSPLEPLMSNALSRTLAAGSAFTTQAQLSALQTPEGWRLELADGPLTLTSASGESLRFVAHAGAAPPSLDLSTGVLTLGGVVTINDAARVHIEALRASSEGLNAAGRLIAPEWSAGEARLSAPDIGFRIEADETGHTLDLSGGAAASGPLAGGVVERLRLPEALSARLPRAGGFALTAAEGRCFALPFSAFTLPALRFEEGSISLCPTGEALVRASPEGALSGGLRIGAVSWSGRQAGEDGAPVALGIGGAEVAINGSVTAPGLDARLREVAFALDRRLVASAPEVTAGLRVADGSWRIDGRFSGAVVTDPGFAVAVDAGEGAWSAAPEGEAAVITVSQAQLRVQDAQPVNETPRFNPLRLTGVSGRFADGVAGFEGVVVLDEDLSTLGRFSASHDFSAGRGAGQFAADTLRFDRRLTPVDLSEFARGVIIGLDGAVNAVVDAQWDGPELRAQAAASYALDRVSTRSLPVIRGVEGEIAFDDLFAFTTPPRQTVRLALINPGVALEDGVVQFQLLAGGKVALENAIWDFAGGQLALEPSIIQLGSEETKLSFDLTEVAVADLIAALKVPDLTMTGRIEGSFPVTLTPTAAIIENGLLNSVGGGTIQYTGQAGADADGPMRLAFDALKNFAYTDFQARLNGNLADKVDIALAFSGLSIGNDLDLTSLIDLPGNQRLTAPDVPFRFNVAINAPFRELVDTASGFTQAPRLPAPLRQNQQPRPQATPVDPEPAQPR